MAWGHLRSYGGRLRLYGGRLRSYYYRVMWGRMGVAKGRRRSCGVISGRLWACGSRMRSYEGDVGGRLRSYGGGAGSA